MSDISGYVVNIHLNNNCKCFYVWVAFLSKVEETVSYTALLVRRHEASKEGFKVSKKEKREKEDLIIIMRTTSGLRKKL